MQSSPYSDLDAIVIGSGVGGLSAAVALARAGRRVAIFEQHALPGGWSHSFSLEGYSFCAGVHYLGELGPGGGLRVLLEGLGLGPHLTVYRQNPDAYEHALVGGERFDWPAGRAPLVARLTDRFPEERHGIARYFDTITRMYDEAGRIPELVGGRSAVSLAVRSPTLLRFGWMRYDRFLDRFTHDPLLRAILAIQAGDHAVPASRCPTAVHTAVTSHYLDGGWFPKGGGRGLVRAFLHALRDHGGEIHVRAPVDGILVSEGRAAGVRLSDGTTVTAPLVVSNADPGVTWGNLVPPELRGRMSKRLRRERWSAGMVSLFFAVEGDVRAMGFDSGNFWFNRSTDLEATYGYARSGRIDPPSQIPGLYLGCSSLKDPTARHDGRHTFEAFSFVPTRPFDRWADSRPDHRPDDYEAFKLAYAGKVFDAIEAFAPGLRDRVVFHTVGTPLTNRHYVAASHGAAYGTERRLGNIGPFGFPIRTSIPGLYQCGASTLCHGVYGASLSGVLAAQLALRCERADLLDAHPAELTAQDAEAAATQPPLSHTA